MAHTTTQRNRNRFTRALTAATTVALGLAAALSNVATAAPPDEPTQQVVVKTSNTTPPIDVVLAVGQTTANLSTFKNALLTKIANKGYNTSIINVQEVKSYSQDIQSSFNWRQNRNMAPYNIAIQQPNFIDPTQGPTYNNFSSWGGTFINKKAEFTNGGSSFAMEGNPQRAGSGANWVSIPRSDNVQKFGFNYSLNFGDNFNSAGMLLNVEESGGYISGTALVLGNTTQSGIATFRYPTSGSTEKNFPLTFTQSFSLPLTGRLEVTTNPGTIQVREVNTNATYTATGSSINQPGSGFGFYSDHYGHGCGRVGTFTFNNLSLTETNQRTLTQVLQAPTFRANSYKLLVNVTDTTEKDFGTPDAKAALISRMLNEEIHYGAWGSPTNQTSNQNFIASNDNKGFALNTSNFTTGIDTTAQYIIDNFYKPGTTSDSDYVVLDEPITVTVDPENLKNNTETEDYPDGRWKLQHDPNHYHNDIGEYPLNNQYQPNLPNTLDRTGKYDIYFETLLVKTVYVHRRPTATVNTTYCPLTGPNCTNNGQTLTPGQISYATDNNDPDTDPTKWEQQENANYGPGITEEKWEHRYVDTNTWTTGKPTTKIRSTPLQIRYTVKDINGAWSTPVIKDISESTSILPVADFNYDTEKISVGNTINITNTSYSPNGANITIHKWLLEKQQGNNWTTQNAWTLNGPNTASLKTDYAPTNTEAGIWRYTLTVTNTYGITSRPFIRTFEVLPDTTKPTITNDITGSTTEWTKTPNTMRTNYEDNGSGLHTWGYSLTTNPTPPTNNNEYTNATTPQITNTPPGDGTYYLHTYATDKTGNINRTTFGPYQIDGTNPTGQCKAQWENPNTQTTINCTGEDQTSKIKNWTYNNQTQTQNPTKFLTTPQPGTHTTTLTDNAGNKTLITITATPQIKLTNPTTTHKTNTNDPTTHVKINTTNTTPLIHTLNNTTVHANNTPLTCQKTTLTPGETTTCEGNIPNTTIK